MSIIATSPEVMIKWIIIIIFKQKLTALTVVVPPNCKDMKWIKAKDRHTDTHIRVNYGGNGLKSSVVKVQM